MKHLSDPSKNFESSNFEVKSDVATGTTQEERSFQFDELIIQNPSIRRGFTGVSSFKNINIKLELFSPENRVKAERLFNKVESQSMIVNSVTTKVDINWIIKE